MSGLPGLGLVASASVEPEVHDSRLIQLSAGSEWRFEVALDSPITVKLQPSSSSGAGDENNTSDTRPKGHNSSNSETITGTAELFGTELAPGHLYSFPGLTKAAIFTHHGCTLAVTGTCESEYTAEETPMVEYTNLHFALENMRGDNSSSSFPGGPRVLVLGPENAGKTSLVKMLAAYAIRGGHTPAVVNMDPREGLLALPGCMSAVVVGMGQLLDIEDPANDGWGSSAVSGPTPMPVKYPLVYHYGYERPEERPEVFKPVATRLALAVTSRFEEDQRVKDAGIIVDMAGSVSSAKGGYDIIQHTVSEFSINVILVLGSERLYSDMMRRYGQPAAAAQSYDGNGSDEAITVLKLPKSGGCVDRDEQYMRDLRKAQVRSYFFGSTKKTILSPHTLSVEFSGLVILRLPDPSQSALDFLPGGGADDGDLAPTSRNAPFESSPITPSFALESTILTLKYASSSSTQDAIRDAPVMGYLYVSEVDDTKNRLRVLCPVAWPPGRLKERVAIAGGYDGVGGGLSGLLSG